MNRVYLVCIALFFLLLPHGLRAQGTNESGDFKLGVELYNDSLFAQAEDQFASFIDRYPNSGSAIEARYYLGLVQVKTGKYRQAANTFSDFALRYQDHPRAVDAWWQLGELYAREHNYAEAGEAFAKLKSFYPKNARAPQALLQAGTYFLRADETENARSVLNAVLLEYPKSDVRFEAQMQLGRLYLAQGEYERALRELQRLLTEAVPASLRPEVIVAIGETRAGLGDREAAEGRYTEAISTYPATMAALKARVRLGDLHRSFRDFSSARAQYVKVAENGNAPPAMRQQAYAGLAETASAEGDDAAALEAWKQLFTSASEGLEPGMIRAAAAAARRAGAYAQSERWLEALYADSLVSTDRQSLLVELGESAREASDIAAALTWYRTYLQNYPSEPGAADALLRIADIEERELQNYSSALDHYTAIGERYGLNRVSDDAQFGRARTLERQGDTRAAAQAYRQLLLLFPASELFGEAEAAYQRLQLAGGGDAERSVRKLADVIAAMHDNESGGQVDLLLARVYLEELGDYVRAERFFNSAQAKGLRGDDAEAADFGAALTVIRLARKGTRTLADAETQCNSFFASHTSGTRHDDLAWELFQLQAASATPAEVLTASAGFLARNPSQHREAALLAAGFAQVELGRDEAAVREFNGIIESGSATDELAAARYGRSMAYAALRKFDEALTDLDASLVRAPNGRYAADALLLQGRLLARVGRYGEAVDAFDDAASRYPYAAVADSARIAVLSVLVEAGRTSDAVARSGRYYRTVMENPFRSDVLRQEYLFAHAVALAKAQQRSEAKKALLRYVDHYGEGQHLGEVLFALGQMYKDEGKIDLASTYLEKSATLKQGSAALRDAADLLLENGKYDRAIDAYTRLIAQSSETAVQRYADSRIVVALFRADRFEDAEARMSAFRSAWPDAEGLLDEFLLERGKYHFRKGEYSKAQDVFDDVEDSDARDIAALGQYWNGRCLEAQSRNTDAREAFQSVVEDHPRTEAALLSMMSLGRMSMRAEKFQDAAMEYKAVIDAGDIPESMLKDALNGVIYAYDALEMYDVAAEMTRKFLNTWPGDATAFRKRVNLGTYLYNLRYYDLALAQYEGLLPDAPPDDMAEIRYYIGECYFFKQDFNRAVQEFLKIPYLIVKKTEMDWASSAYDYAARAYKELGKYELAIDMYQKIIDTPGVDPRFRAEAEKRSKEIRALMN
ncbi:tetratricopeptide repeat protein [bacterium]|nr:tetratricopeptide repeat protein [bacterium]